MPLISELGRTRLFTRRERRRRLAAVLVALAGAVIAAWIGAAIVSWLASGDPSWPTLRLRSPLTRSGDGGILGLPRGDQNPPPDPDSGGARRPRFPVTLTWPAPLGWTAVVALPLWLVWLRWAVAPVLAGLRYPARHDGLAHRRAIRRVLGVRAVRRAGRYTLPGSTRLRRWVLPTSAFGYHLGHPRHPTQPIPRPRSRVWRGMGRREALWADWEQRVRIVARTGWGKTDRALVPIIRALPGPALVASIEPAIFNATVLARQYRRPALRWPWLSMLLGHWLPTREYPVAVVDVSAPDRRYAAGYPQVHWTPIIGCADYAIAYRRAVALVAGIETPQHTQGSGSDNDQFFRDSASEVLAAWLHAADLASKNVDDLVDWLRHPDDPTPARILRDHPTAEPSAAVNITRHLDPTAARTTSGVLRYLTLALNSLTSTDGRRLCGHRDTTTEAGAQFDMERHIVAGGTVYVLADSSRVHRVKPLLSLFATEMFLAAEAVALRTRHRRLPTPFIAVIDELRYGITIPNLPYVASAQRKYGIGYVYGVQTASQEDAVYGPDAPALRAAAGVSIIGGIDIDSARELSDRAGTTTVVTPTRGTRHDPGGHTEQLQPQAALTIADQQRLPDGHAVITARGLTPFLAYLPSYRDHRRTHRAITTEADTVARHVTGARTRDHTTHDRQHTATAAGADFTPPGRPS
jgi:TraM recognition site of TraD and TraG